MWVQDTQSKRPRGLWIPLSQMVYLSPAGIIQLNDGGQVYIPAEEIQAVRERLANYIIDQGAEPRRAA